MKRQVGLISLSFIFAFVIGLTVQSANAGPITLEPIAAEGGGAALVRPKSAIIENRPIWDYNLGKVVGLEQRVKMVKNKRIVKLYPYSQTLMTKSLTYLDPDAGYSVVAGGGCTSDVQVDVLAMHMTYGSNGPQVRARLAYRYLQAGQTAGAEDPPAWRPEGEPAMFSPAYNITGGEHTSFANSPGSQLELKAMMAYPEFESATLQNLALSSSGDFGAVLASGDNVVAKLGQKANVSFSGQPSVLTILAPYLDANGNLTGLGSNEMIYLFELGVTNASSTSAAYDFQDVVLKVTMPCDVGQEVVLRDSIGPNSSTTNGNWILDSWRTGTNAWNMPAAIIPVTENVTLSSIKLVGAQIGNIFDPNQYDYRLEVWSSEAEAISNPLNGDRTSSLPDFLAPDEVTTGWGQGYDSIDFFPARRIGFNLSSYNISALAGETIVVGVQVLTNGSIPGGGGLFGWLESTENGTSDIAASSDFSGWEVLDEADYGPPHNHGRIAIELRGVTQ